MKKGLIIALFAIASSIVAYAGANSQSDCCDTSTCCPSEAETAECGAKGCE